MKGLRGVLSSVRLPALSILVALLVGGLVIMFSDLEVLAMIPSNPIGALGEGISRVGRHTRRCFVARSGIQSVLRRRSHQVILQSSHVPHAQSPKAFSSPFR